MMKKKLYLIVFINLGLKTLAMLNIKIIIKYNNITYQINFKNRFKGKIKSKSNNINWWMA